jgi:hypothetical protein
VARVFSGCELSFGQSDGDNRSYRVRFDKIHALLPGFHCRMNAAMGAQELFDLFTRIDMLPEDFDFRAYTRLKQLCHLIRTGQIDESFYWTKVTFATSLKTTSSSSELPQYSSAN